jgi:toxin-antitoxin system PIN domain toxin
VNSPKVRPPKAGLLDINVLIALMDPAHQFHPAAHTWFGHNRKHGWATCPITENGCLRILSKPGYPAPGLTAERVRGMLAELTGIEGHQFWPDSVSMLEPNRFNLSGAGPKNITDLYLLRLATKFRGIFVTFDRTIRWQWITGCNPDNVEVLG